MPGIGPKIAATLMRKFGSLDELYANVGRVAALGLRGGGALGERLAAHRESVFLARRLTRIVCDMPLGVCAADLRPRTPDLASLGALYDRLGFGPLLRRQGERLARAVRHRRRGDRKLSIRAGDFAFERDTDEDGGGFEAIAREIGAQMGSDCAPEPESAVAGGSIHRCYRWRCGDTQLS